MTSYVLLLTIQGSLVAYLLPAAGPALHGTMHPGSSRFAALVVTLRDQDAFLRAHGFSGLYSMRIQHGLIELFAQQSLAIGGGISAMPSLHNALAMLFACAAWSIGRRTGMVASLYVFVIWVGSIHLGWHYALDGIVAWTLTLVTWFGVGRLTTLFDWLGANAPARRIKVVPAVEPQLAPT